MSLIIGARHKGSHQKYTKTIHNNTLHTGTYNPRHYNHHAIYKSTQEFDYYIILFVKRCSYIFYINIGTTKLNLHISLYNIYLIYCTYIVCIVHDNNSNNNIQII